MGKTESENVRVVVRVRPISNKEEQLGMKEAVTTNVADNSITVRTDDQQFKTFSFDQIYNKQFSQKSIYIQSIHPLVESVLSGYNATAFAYGQSGTGKTHTMTGKISTPDQGVIPNALEHIFESIGTEDPESKKQYSLSVSYLELYNGRCRDLLTDTKRSLELKENEHKLFYVKDLEKVKVHSMEQCMRIMEEGSTRREVGSTQLNQDSSRSHSVFTIEITCTNYEEEPVTTLTSKLNLVDLAGSERQTKTAAEGDRLKEGSNINLSLTALGTVIDVLVKGRGHIPFRSSPLTMLLKDSLGGNSKTIMFATCGPTDVNTQETLSTLRFADRAKRIKNKPKLQLDPKDALIQQLREEISVLKSKLGSDYDFDEAEKAEQAQIQLANCRDELVVANQEFDALKLRYAADLSDNSDKENQINSLKEEVKVGVDQVDDLSTQLLETSKVVSQYILNNATSKSSNKWKAKLASSGLDPHSEAIPPGLLSTGLSYIKSDPVSNGTAIKEIHQTNISNNNDNGFNRVTSPSPTLPDTPGSDERVSPTQKNSKKKKKRKGNSDVSNGKTVDIDAIVLKFCQNKPEMEDTMRKALEHQASSWDKERRKAAKEVLTIRSAQQEVSQAMHNNVQQMDGTMRAYNQEMIRKVMQAEERLEEALVDRDKTVAQLSKQRATLEKVKKIANTKQMASDEQQQAIVNLKKEQNDKEVQFRERLQIEQAKLIEENNKRFETLVANNTKEVAKVKKSAAETRKRLKKLNENYGDMEQAHDQKVVEFNALLKDFEELKITSMKQLRECEESFGSGGGGQQKGWPVNQNTIKLTSIAAAVMKNLATSNNNCERPAKSAPLKSGTPTDMDSLCQSRRPMSSIHEVTKSAEAPFTKPPLPGLLSDPTNGSIIQKEASQEIQPIPPQFSRSPLGGFSSARKYAD